MTTAFAQNGILCFGDGTVFEGHIYSPGTSCVRGEVVFTTGMVGYVESLTDPSYSGQILVFTYPLIGNYGVPDKKAWESDRVWPCAVVISEAAVHVSHCESVLSLREWLTKQSVPLLEGVDTRCVTQTIREHGTFLGTVSAKSHRCDIDCASQHPAESTNLISQVSAREKTIFGIGEKTIILVDCGMKRSILRSLVACGVRVRVVPFDYDYSAETFDGVVLSNGPGDPMSAREIIAILEKAMRREKPIFGICLGAQLLALAAGGKTYKLPYGHRGHNQPCIEIATGRAIITSQNHGYAVDEASLPADWEITYRNLNDRSVEGISHQSLPFFGVQFHPEASPGPTEAQRFFQDFIRVIDVA